MDGRNYELVITLKSDLCLGTGYSYAGIIDSDICYDAYGIPYIAAKRMKGCLREAAELIGFSEEERNQIFGKGGEDGINGICIENGYIEDYAYILSDCQKLEQDQRKFITTQRILAQFTTAKAQTKINNCGAAEDNTLRFVRTLNHYSPLKPNQEMRFYATVTLPGNLSEEKAKEISEKIEKIVKALRNIGMNRNRGLGSVRCEWKTFENKNKLAPLHKGEQGIEECDEDAEYILQYSVRNVSPLILSNINDYKTEKYISGRTVLGFFAGEYLRGTDDGKDRSPEDENFKDLFLRNKVKFGALYPAGEIPDPEDSASDRKKRKVYYPVPACFYRLKKTKKFVNITKEVPETEKRCRELGINTEYATQMANQPKRLKDKFVYIEQDFDGKIKIQLKEPETDIMYHHTRKSDKQNASDGNLLYTTEALREQQVFAGEIRGSGRYIKILEKLLRNPILRFGKSKSSQYGTCILAEEPLITKKEQGRILFPKGSLVLAVLESDAIFLNDLGYTVQCNEVREQVKTSVGLDEISVGTQEEAYAEIEAGILAGYYAKWNMKRVAIPVVKAGSTFAFRLSKDLELQEEIAWTGEKNGEGFGRLRILKNDGAACCVEEIEIKEEKKSQNPQYATDLFRKILVGEAREQLMLQAVRTQLNFENSAALGRVTLMLSESADAYPRDAEKRYEDFAKRIASIKKEELKDKAGEILRKYICNGETLKSESCCIKYWRIVKKLEDPYKKLLTEKDPADAFEKEMSGLWSEYLMAMLVQEKYNLKHREGSHE